LITPLALAVMQGGYTNYIKLLLKAGADPNIPDDVCSIFILLLQEPVYIRCYHQSKDELKEIICTFLSIYLHVDSSVLPVQISVVSQSLLLLKRLS
jgi:hypothetical protein